MPTFRYKQDGSLITELYRFSKIHEFDTRNDFKKYWTGWVYENSDIIEQETERLKKMGYEGDVTDKLFKSARYYLRKKSTDKKTPIKRRNYVTIEKSILAVMDQHIKNEMNKPEKGFYDFCISHRDLLKNEIKRLQDNGITDEKMIQTKFKKTYKNRYYMIKI
jgi:hypothetical protein